MVQSIVLARSSMASKRSLCYQLSAVSLPARYTLVAWHLACRVTSKHEDRKRESIVVVDSSESRLARKLPSLWPLLSRHPWEDAESRAHDQPFRKM
jgi:hypothetical protein